MSIFNSTPAKILYFLLLAAVVYFAAQQKMKNAGVQGPPPSEPTGLAPAR